jgi:hypothetical protein
MLIKRTYRLCQIGDVGVDGRLDLVFGWRRHGCDLLVILEIYARYTSLFYIGTISLDVFEN